MDRNDVRHTTSARPSIVALRKESVDRNPVCYSSGHRQAVALRKESVDRNTIITQTVSEVIGSLSARRAWIEIKTPHKTS